LKLFTVGILSLSLIIGIVLIWNSGEQSPGRAYTEDDTAFQHAASSGTEQAYRDYLAAHRSGRHVKEVISRLDDLGYQKAVKAGSKPGYQAYLSSWPQGRHVSEAKAKITALTKRIAILKRRIENSKSVLSTMESELKPLEKQLEDYKLKITEFQSSQAALTPGDSGSVDREGYSNVDTFNAVVRKYNSLLSEYQPKYEEYKKLLDKTNNDIARCNAALGIR